MRSTAGVSLLAGQLLWITCAIAVGVQREFTEDDAASWQSISNVKLARSGDWLAYLLVPDGGVFARSGGTVVVLRRLADGLERRYSAGTLAPGMSQLRMSASGRWLAFRTAEHRSNTWLEAQEESTTSGTRIQIVEIHSGKTRAEFQNVQTFTFAGLDENEWLIVQHVAPNNAYFQLSLYSLRTGATRTLETISAFALDPQGTRIAACTKEGLVLYDLQLQRADRLDPSRGYDYRTPSWSDTGTALAVLRRPRTGIEEIMIFSDLHRESWKRAVFQVAQAAGFPAGYELAGSPEQPLKGLLWRNDQKGLFFWVRERARAIEGVPNLTLWHWKDIRLPMQKRIENLEDGPPVYLTLLSLPSGRVTRLADATIPNVEARTTGRYALAFDSEIYATPQNPNSTGTGRSVQRRDYYLIDLQTGDRKNVIAGLGVLVNESLAATPRLSPDGSTLLYQQDGDYVVLDVATGRRKNLTAGLPTRFYFERNSRNSRQLQDSDGWLRSVFQGWSCDGAYVLISDYYDVWALPLKGGRARNLTGRGRRHNQTFQLAVTGDASPVPEKLSNENVDLNRVTYFQVIDHDTGETGIARRVPWRDGADVMRMESAATRYYKADYADVFLFARMTATEPMNLYLLRPARRGVIKLTDLNSQQRGIKWSAGAKYLSYRTTAGDALHAVLHLPAGFVPGQSYPTIVSIYEKQSQTLHGYIGPHSSYFRYLRDGYAILLPDIQPQLDEPGSAALDAVRAAVDVACTTGIVDRQRLGLMGHSYGAYETVFIISRSRLFKAAVAYAGMTNLISDYGAVWASGVPKSFFYDNEQPYLRGPWWQDWQAYQRNSPLTHADSIYTPLLLVHGTQDRAVPFAQSVELFNTLRRMGRSVVMLEYTHEDHTLEDDVSRADMEQRVLQFFAHFLKDDAAPAWWSDGISYPSGELPEADLSR